LTHTVDSGVDFVAPVSAGAGCCSVCATSFANDSDASWAHYFSTRFAFWAYTWHFNVNLIQTFCRNIQN